MTDMNIETAAELAARSRRSDKRWKIGLALLVLILVMLGAVAVNTAAQNELLAKANGTQATAQALQKQDLAQSLAAACDNGQVVKSQAGVNLCDKAQRIADQPLPSPAAGPEGPKGEQGPQGPQGPAGRNGTDGTNGPPGTPGTNGTNGLAGTNGTNGPPGTNGTDGAPGPSGPPGPAGATGPQGATGAQGPQGDTGPTGPAGPQGPAGKDPSQFTFTDITGRKYTCVPNPPGSSTYTCTAGK